MKKILVLDDNTSITRSLKKLLEKLGHEVDTGYDGREGISLIEQNDYDLIISDMIMPEIDGHDIGKYLSKNRPGTPLLIMTGGGTLLTKEMAEEIAQEITKYILIKPFDTNSLQNKLDEIFSSASSNIKK